MRRRFAVASIAVLAALAACGHPGQPARPPSVEALPAPSLPPWIAQIAPAGTAQPRSQIRVIFAQPLLAVQALGSADESAVLSHFRLIPAIGGAFVVLTPRMVAYQTDAPLPPATRFRVTLTAGLKDVRGDGLARDLAWTFATQPLQISLPDAYSTPSGTVGLRPAVPVQLNADVDRADLSAHAQFKDTEDGSAVQAVVTAAPSPPADAFVYDLSPSSDLRKGARYELIVDPGILPLHGNLAGTGRLRLPLLTYGNLDFVGPEPTSDPYSDPKSRFAGGDPAFAFTNALDPKTYAAHVRVQPSPGPAGKVISLSGDGTAILVNPYALRPRANYRITVDADLLDVFGQRLGRTVDVPFTTPELAPYFWAPESQYTFVAGQQLQLEYTAVNLPGNRYRAAYRVVQPEEIAAAPYSAGPDRLPKGSWPVRTFSAQRDRETQIPVPLQSLLGGPFGLLAYGAQPFANRTYGGTVQLTNLGVFAQLFPGSIDVAVQHLDDGAPVRRATIELYVPHDVPNGPDARLCARAQTGDDGTFSLTGPLVQSCYAQNLPEAQAPALLVVARQGSDWAYALVEQWSGIYEYSSSYMEGAWTSGAPVSRGTIFSDRQMYQPGERGWFTAVCYVLQNGALRADRGASYTLKLRDPDGNSRPLSAQTTGRFATFSFPIDFSKTQTPGYYTLEATSPDGARITGGFRVAHFRPPNFAVDLKLDKTFAAAGSSVQASGAAHYLFGAPMSGAQATLHVTRTQTAYTPPGRDEYTFGRQWPWPDQPPDVDSDVLAKAVTLDSSGGAAAAVPVDGDLPYAMTYDVDLEATDVSHLATSATQSFTALPATSLIGLKGDFVGSAGSPISAAAIVTDPQGKPISGSHLHVLLQKIEYSGVTQIVEGGEAARNQVTYETVAQADVVTGTDAAAFSFTPADSGPYRIRANFSGAAGDATATDMQVWVTGPGNASWGGQNAAQLQLKLDKPAYQEGQTAIVAAASPYRQADLYLSVVRDRVLWKTVLHLNGAAPKVRIPLTQAMFPNAAVEGVLVRRGPKLARGVQDVDALVRIGLVPLTMSLDGTSVKLQITPRLAKAQPAQQQTLTLHVAGASNRPVQAQVTVAVVDDAILQLSGYRFPDLTKIVYAAQPIATRFADNRPNVTLTQPANTNEKGWGYGGGFLEGAASTRVRTQFVPFAYFNGAVQTDAHGDARVSFKVPDNLTTWRILAVAATADARPKFATADATFIASKPLVTDPLLPRFARPGDRFAGGLLLANGASSSVAARTQADLRGAVRFAAGNGTTVQASRDVARGMNAWRFDMLADRAGTAHLTVRTELASGPADAFSVPLEVRNEAATESVVDAGSTQGAASIPLTVGSARGSVTVDVSGSVLSQVEGPARNALTAEDTGLLTDEASRLSIAASLLRLQLTLHAQISAVNPRAAAQDAIGNLRALQRIDGGFSFWPEERASDAFGSVQALNAFAQARAANLDVSAESIARAKAYAVRALADPAGAAAWCRDSQCKASLRLQALSALAALGDRRTDFLQSLYDMRPRLTAVQRVQLALYLQQTPGFSQQARQLALELRNDLSMSGRYAQLQPSRAWESSNVEGQAAYVRLLLARSSPPDDLNRAMQALVAQQCRCGWPSPADTAAALLAAVDYSAAQSANPDFSFEIAIDGKRVAGGRIHGAGAPVQTLALPQLPAGPHTVRVSKTGRGTLAYLVSYAYDAGPQAPGRLAGLRVERSVRAANARDVLASMDLAPQSAPFDVPAGNVYDVEVRVIADHAVDRVVVQDPLPAGFEALDTSFQTTAAYYQPLADDWQIDYQRIYADKIVAFAQHLEPGVYAFHYLARSVTPGTFLWPGARAYLTSAPEQFGRSAFAQVRISGK